MSMWEPMTPDRHQPEDEIAAADPGAGAPETDRPGETALGGAGTADTVFRTPDPDDVRRDPAG